MSTTPDAVATTGPPDKKARGTSDTGTQNRLGPPPPSDAELRRADYRDAYREGMISRLSEEKLAAESIPSLLILARQAAGGVSEGWGPRTMYAHAANLLILYMHLLDRARTSARGRNDELLTTKPQSMELVPWTANRVRRVEELPEFNAASLEKWNSIIALGPPPPYDARTPWNGVRKPKVTLIQDLRPKPGLGRGAGAQRLPFGLIGVFRPGGPDARLIYRLLKTDEMNADTPEGRKFVLSAVIAQILHNQHSETFYDDAATAMLKRDGSSRGALYANDPDAFRRKPTGEEFRFEVGIAFLLNLDEVTGGQVELKTLQLLEPGYDIRPGEPRPLWQELYPNNTQRERAQWIWKRIQGALPLYDPRSGRGKPGHFYESNDMIYVSDGMFPGDKIWATKDGRIFAVNEREELIEAFRQGVMTAAGMVAVAYMQIALALILVEAPAIAANIYQIVTAPVASTARLLAFIRAEPLAALGTVAAGQASSFLLSQDKEHWLKTFGDAGTWLEILFTVITLTDLRKGIVLPEGGGTFIKVGNELHFVPAPAPKTAVLTDPKPVAPVNDPVPLAEPTKPAAQPKASASPAVEKPVSVVDEGASVVIQSDRNAPESVGDAAKNSPESAGDAPRTPPESAGDVPERAAEGISQANVQDRQGVTSRGGVDDATAKMTSQRANDNRLGKPAKEDAEEAQAATKVANESGGRKAGGGSGKKKSSGGKPSTGRKGRASGKREASPEGENSKGAPGKRENGTGGRGKKSAASTGRAVDGNRGTTEEVAEFTRGGIRYSARVSRTANQVYDAIPEGNTVVYTLHNEHGEVIYVGITKKTAERGALMRLQEHLTTKDGVFISNASEFRIRGHYADEAEAHALEHYLVTTSETTKTYNRDQDPWGTFVNYNKAAAERYQRAPSGVDGEMRANLRQPSGGKPDPDYTLKLPEEMARPIRFEIDFGGDLKPIRGPDPDGGPGVHPDYDPPFDPKTDL